MSLDLGWGLGRRGASRHFFVCHGGGTPLGAFLACPASPPFFSVFSAAQQPCRERRLPIALPRRAPCAPVTVRTQALDSFAPRVSLDYFLCAIW